MKPIKNWHDFKNIIHIKGGFRQVLAKLIGGIPSHGITENEWLEDYSKYHNQNQMIEVLKKLQISTICKKDKGVKNVKSTKFNRSNFK